MLSCIDVGKNETSAYACRTSFVWLITNNQKHTYTYRIFKLFYSVGSLFLVFRSSLASIGVSIDLINIWQSHFVVYIFLHSFFLLLLLPAFACICFAAAIFFLFPFVFFSPLSLILYERHLDYILYMLYDGGSVFFSSTYFWLLFFSRRFSKFFDWENKSFIFNVNCVHFHFCIRIVQHVAFHSFCWWLRLAKMWYNSRYANKNLFVVVSFSLKNFLLRFDFCLSMQYYHTFGFFSIV